MPSVTVGITFHNAEATLFGALQSVFAQTYQDWELVLVDDASTDSSLEIARSVVDARVSVATVPEKRGFSWCLNEIARRAGGSYLARMDADDLMHPRRLERQVEYLDGHPSVAVAGSGAYVLDEHGVVQGIQGMQAPDISGFGLLRYVPMMHPTVTGRTEWFRQNPYDETFPRSEDHELWCRTGARTEFGHIGEALLFYRDGARGNWRKYTETARHDRRIFRKYGKEQAGYLRTGRLLAYSYLKPQIYRLATYAGLESRLLRMRNDRMTERHCRDASAALRTIANVGVPRR